MTKSNIIINIPLLLNEISFKKTDSSEDGTIHPPTNGLQATLYILSFTSHLFNNPSVLRTMGRTSKTVRSPCSSPTKKNYKNPSFIYKILYIYFFTEATSKKFENLLLNYIKFRFSTFGPSKSFKISPFYHEEFIIFLHMPQKNFILHSAPPKKFFLFAR